MEQIESLTKEMQDFKYVVQRQFIELLNEMNHLRKRIEQSESEQPSNIDVQLQVIPQSEAKSRIKEYIDTHPGVTTSDIIVELGLAPDLVIDCLQVLQEENQIKGESNE